MVSRRLRAWLGSWMMAALLVLPSLISGASADEKTVLYSETFLPHACAEKIAKEGNTVYVAQHDGGVDVIDVSNPSSPTLLGSIDPDGPNNSVDIWDVQVLNGTLYAFNRGLTIDPIKGNWTGCYMYDVSVPSFPIEVGAIVYGTQPWHHLGAYTISAEVGLISGVPHVFICSSISSQVEIFDVSNPAIAVYQSTVYTPGTGYYQALQTVYQDNKLYTAWGDGGFTIDDVSDPTNPIRLGHRTYTGPLVVNGGLQTICPTPDGQHVVTGEYTTQGDVRLWNVSNPGAITQAASWRLNTGALLWTVHATNDYAYVAHLEDGIRILNIQSRTSLTPAGFFDPNAGTPARDWLGISDIVFDGMTMYACHSARGLFIVEHDPYLPVQDVVTVTFAEYSRSRKKLTVYATSNQQPTPTLTVAGYGVMTWSNTRSRYEKVISLRSAPASVTVNSSAGGSASRNVTSVR